MRDEFKTRQEGVLAIDALVSYANDLDDRADCAPYAVNRDELRSKARFAIEIAVKIAKAFGLRKHLMRKLLPI